MSRKSCEHQIVNHYDATGKKYKTINYTNIRSAKTDYNDIAYYTYDTDSIEYEVTEYLGNIMKTTTKNAVGLTHKQKIFNATGYYADGKYYHYVKNHLGGICMVLESESGNIVQNTSYSASGIPSSTALDEQPYLYNGKEFVEAHGLNEYDSQARMYYATIMRTTTMDPHAENNYHQSPYSWCSNNPVNRIDPNGMDDEFDKEGRYIRHVDNGTDYVMVENANGEMQNLTEFSYGENDAANIAMLGNVTTYYAHQIGLDQTLDVCDVEREGAVAMTDVKSDFHQVCMAVVDGRLDPIANTSHNIMNALVHENDHGVSGVGGPLAEVSAVMKEMSHPTWLKTTEAYKSGAVTYLLSNMNKAMTDPGNFETIKALISPNMGIINQLGYTIEFVNNNFVVSYGFPDFEVTAKRK